MPRAEQEGFYICSKCGVPKPLSEYHHHANTSPYPSQCHNSACKPCRSLVDKIDTPRRNAAKKHGVLVHYSGGQPKCACCGITEERFLTMNHIDGSGAAHRRAIGGGGPKLYAWLIRNGYPEGFNVLCWNCNSSTCNGGICPHEEARLLSQVAD
jgi:hypothetical protein